MQVHLDKDFQIRLPEALVRELRLEPNSTLELTVQNNKLVLEREPEEAVLVKVGNVWVAQTQLVDSSDEDWVAKMREERMREVSGL